MKKYLPSKWIKLGSVIIILILLVLLFKTIYSYIDSYFEVPDNGSLIPNLNDPDKFVKYGYPEIKSLSIQFLTLVTAILVFSITFSEKIINYNQTKNSIRLTLTLGWAFLIFAIVTNGIGLAYNAFALSISLVDLNINQTDSLKIAGSFNPIISSSNSVNSSIANSEHKIVSAEFYEPAFQSLKAILMSGVFFVSGLICILIAGVVSIFQRTKTSS
ncbi:hypothetical protein [Limnovirga soli]|uniref:Uncharacterized protein n=1 Tax=Limnovirga soli TaxID=2656915 RepID=A0A8J8FJ66_9BACT|nr:hypothetical protein [Limnovirga soli]NNV57299.1 hypothetical protein [Limnovirga soli]